MAVMILSVVMMTPVVAEITFKVAGSVSDHFFSGQDHFCGGRYHFVSG